MSDYTYRGINYRLSCLMGNDNYRLNIFCFLLSDNLNQDLMGEFSVGFSYTRRKAEKYIDDLYDRLLTNYDDSLKMLDDYIKYDNSDIKFQAISLKGELMKMNKKKSPNLDCVDMGDAIEWLEENTEYMDYVASEHFRRTGEIIPGYCNLDENDDE